MIRINRLWINDFKNIRGQNFNFSNHDGLTLLIGNNGSGKSNVLEFISNVFKTLFGGESDFKSNFEIEWVSDGSANKVKFYNGHLIEERNGSAASVNNTMDYPKRVVAIYSGESERLWATFYKPCYDTFISNINQNQQQGALNVNNVFPKMLYLNRFYWNVALLSLMRSDSPDVQDFLRNGIRIQRVGKIIFKFKERQSYANFAVSPVLQFVHLIDGKTEYTLDEFNQILDSAGIDAQQLFEYLYIAFSPKNSKIIENVVVEFNTNLTIEDMSEGLKKRLLVRAALELAGHEDTLYLLDEPDAHVHVDNKVRIIETIKQFKQHRHIFVTTHSPSVCKVVDTQSIILMNEGKPEPVNNQLEAGKKLASDIVLINMLFTNKHLILTEGKTDILYIRKAISLFATDYPVLAGSTEFVELSGTDGGADLDFMGKIAPIAGRKIIRLVDRDVKGLDCAKKIIGQPRWKKANFNAAIDVPNMQETKVVMLPLKQGVTGEADFIIEDYFKADKIKELTKNYIDSSFNGRNFNGFPAVKDDLKKSLLPAFCPTAQAADMEDFRVLLDILENTLTA